MSRLGLQPALCRAGGLLAALLLCQPAAATPLPSAQDIAAYKASGEWDRVRANLETVHGYMNNSEGLSEDEALELLRTGYGLPTSKTRPDERAGDLRVNFDSNSVLDERDVLGLGFEDLRRPASLARGASTTLPYGTVAAGNQPRCLVLLIKFSDQAPTDKKNQRWGGGADVNHDKDWAFDKWFDETDPPSLAQMSVSNYYKKSSYGKLQLKGDVFYNAAVCDSEGWITAGNGYTYADIQNGNVSYGNVTQDAIAQADPHVDFKNYDSNGDGYLDGLITIYAGPDDIASDPDLWYFRWWSQPGYNTSDSVRIGSGLWVSEEGWLYMFAHEFGHELGLPDLYDVGDEISGDPTPGNGYWTLMSSWYAPDMGEVPPTGDAWSRMHLRWVDPIDVLTQDSAVSFTVNRATAATADNTVYRVWRNGQRGPEYYLVEFRDGDHDIDNCLPGLGGLLIWHVDETRTSAVNHNNSFLPMRLRLETADNDPPTETNNPWRSGFTGDGDPGDGDGTDGDYFWDFSIPDAKDNDGAVTGVVIDPTSDNSGSSMTFTVENTTNGTLPSLSWDTPGAGASVSGTLLVDVTSDANSEVRYYVNGCLKRREVGPAPYDGFQWDTLTALNGSAKLTAIAFNSGAGELVRVIERTVTVNNPQASGKSLNFTDNFNSYSSDLDPTLLSLWNFYEDDMTALQVLWQDFPRVGGSGGSLSLAQNSFPTPPFDNNDDDPNAGVYQGQDREYIMSPRINLAGYSALTLKYKVAFRGTAYGEIIMQTQITDDDGATWKDLEGLTENNFASSSPYDTGSWQGNVFVQRTLNLNSYINKQVYVRFMFYGGLGYNPGFAIEDFELSGIQFVLNSVNPSRLKVGDAITLSGSGFGASQGDGEVRFNNGSGGHVSQSSVISWNDTSIVCLVPSGAVSELTNGIWVYKSALETNKKALKVILPPPSLGGLGQL